MNLLQEIFIYFAQYPKFEAVEKIFNRNSSVTSNLKKRLSTIDVKNKYPQITDYIFGVNEDVVKKKISLVKGIYLFIDYGNIDTKLTDKNVKYDSFQVAITVAKVTSSATFNSAEELIISDDLLNIITGIRNDLREDKENPLLKWISFPNTISPFFARELSNSYGWTLMFTISGVDLI